jgi:hypothetical protein
MRRMTRFGQSVVAFRFRTTVNDTQTHTLANLLEFDELLRLCLLLLLLLFLLFLLGHLLLLLTGAVTT